MDSVAPPGLSLVSILSLLACSIQVLAAILLTHRFGGRSSVTDRWILLWLFYDVIVHLTLTQTLSPVCLSPVCLSPVCLSVGREYSKADSRWLVSDPTIVSIEILTVVLDSVLGVLLIYAVLKDQYYRHFLQVALSVCELYGGWMTFCPDWLIGSPHLDTSSRLHLWVYLVFFNGVWVLVPVLLLVQSWFCLRITQTVSLN
uniref:EXPERA domain-containing protein n=1 Tax=Scophthalmus maximus TaxID=52904 RepID=A0A8D3C226_SCOMX